MYGCNSSFPTWKTVQLNFEPLWNVNFQYPVFNYMLHEGQVGEQLLCKPDISLLPNSSFLRRLAEEEWSISSQTEKINKMKQNKKRRRRKKIWGQALEDLGFYQNLNIYYWEKQAPNLQNQSMFLKAWVLCKVKNKNVLILNTMH